MLVVQGMQSLFTVHSIISSIIISVRIVRRRQPSIHTDTPGGMLVSNSTVCVEID